jgi:hypothetical protein
LISIFIIIFILKGELIQIPPVLFTFGGLIIALSLHYISAGNTVYSISVPLGNKELFKKAHSISLGASQIATSGTILVFVGLLSHLGKNQIIESVFRPMLCVFAAISLLLLWSGLLYTLQFFPWITIDEIPPKDKTDTKKEDIKS